MSTSLLAHGDNLPTPLKAMSGLIPTKLSRQSFVPSQLTHSSVHDLDQDGELKHALDSLTAVSSPGLPWKAGVGGYGTLEDKGGCVPLAPSQQAM